MNDSPLSQYLRLLRTDSGHTQDEVAKYLGITRATYSHYETARLMPPTDALYKLSAYYKVSLSRLIKLSVASSSKENGDIKAVDYVVTDDDIKEGQDALYQKFLSECSDFSAQQLIKWMSVDDRELIFYYHQLSGREKRLVNYYMKLLVLNRTSTVID